MKKPNSTETRRRILFASGAGLFGITSILAGWMAKVRGRGNARERAKRMAGRLDLPQGAGAMTEAFARDPEKIERFRELTRWRQMRDKEHHKV
jgi:hypothetical protein